MKHLYGQVGAWEDTACIDDDCREVKQRSTVTDIDMITKSHIYMIT